MEVFHTPPCLTSKQGSRVSGLAHTLYHWTPATTTHNSIFCLKPSAPKNGRFHYGYVSFQDVADRFRRPLMPCGESSAAFYLMTSEFGGKLLRVLTTTLPFYTDRPTHHARRTAPEPYTQHKGDILLRSQSNPSLDARLC